MTMASSLITRFLPINGGASPSIYETLRQYDADSDASDGEERGGLSVDEENLGSRYQDYELEDALAEGSDGHSTQSSPLFHQTSSSKFNRRLSAARTSRSSDKSPWREASTAARVDDGDDEVPASLLVEGDVDEDSLPPPPPPPNRNGARNGDPGPTFPTRPLRDNWDSPRERRPLHPTPPRVPPPFKWSLNQRSGLTFADPKEKAMWRWANVENLDNYLRDVYVYFIGNGIWCIVLSRVLNILTLAFVVGFTTFLTSCVDYRKVRHSKTLTEVLVPQCTKKMPMGSTFLLWLFTLFWFGKIFQYIVDFRRLRHMHDFYHFLLGISDIDIQTISWQEVVSRLMALRDANPATAGTVSTKHRRLLGSQSKQRMDAHDIANRLMRKENYLIALFNKDILNLTLPTPFLRNRQLFSRTLEWNLNLCVLDYVFNEQGQLRPAFLKANHRRALSDGLRRRFIFAGVMNIFVAPFIVTYFLMHFFFRYFNEYQKNPSSLSSRQYTPLAEWKFREFNELWHLFERRINLSYEPASKYINQFPKDKTIQLWRFVAFLAGALGSVLFIASIVDPELFLGFEITPDKTVLFYLGVFGSIYAVARGAAPDRPQVFDPEHALLHVASFTHYKPAHWQGKLHSDEVRREFSSLYQLSLAIFLEEILSMIFTPFVLWFSLPKCSDRLIDFFREFTIHVDGLGYVCSFAVFDFKRGTNLVPQDHHTDVYGQLAPGQQDLRQDYFSSKNGKMLQSYIGFLDNYGGNPRPRHPGGFNAQGNAQCPVYPDLGSPSHTTQPGPSGTTEPRGRGQSLSRTRRFRASSVAEGHHSPLPSVLLDRRHQPPMSEDSQLDKSWRMNLDGDTDDGEGEETEDVQAIVGDAGVLGLIHQFQKASNEGRGTVGI